MIRWGDLPDLVAADADAAASVDPYAGCPFDWGALWEAARPRLQGRRFTRVLALDTEFDACWFERPRVIDHPRLACVQMVGLDLVTGQVSEPILYHNTDPAARASFEAALADHGCLIVGLNTSIDMWVCADAWGLADAVAEKYNRGEVGDVDLRERMDALARPGREAWVSEADPDDDADAHSSAPWRRKKGFRVWRKHRWSAGAGAFDAFGNAGSIVKGLPKGKRLTSMEAVIWRRFGVDLAEDKKGEDSWRLRYGELVDVPLAQWPLAAVLYAIKDGPRTLAAWLHQAARPPMPYERAGAWWDGLTGGVDGAALFEHEADRAEYAWILETIAQGPGFPVDLPYAQSVHARYQALEGAARGILDAAGVIDHKKDSIKKAPVLAACQAAYLASDVPPDPTDTGRKKFPKVEGTPLRDWPEEARQYVSTGGNSVQWVLNPQGDDACAIVDDPVNGLDWSADRLAAAVAATAAPIVVAKNVAAKAHAMGGVVAKFIECEAARPDYNPLLNTGRCSARGDLPQNLGRGGYIRECLRPRPGWALTISDYAQIELVAFSWLLDRITEKVCGYPRNSYQGPLTQAINAGKDAHILLGLRIMRAPDDFTHDRAKALKAQVEGILDALGGDKSRAKAEHPDIVWDIALAMLDARQKAKAGNYGYGGGMGPRGFVRAQAKQGTMFTLDEAADIHREWKAIWETGPYFAFISEMDRKGSKNNTGIMLRVPGSGLRAGGRTFTQAANILFQGLCAKLMKDAAKLIYRACEGHGPGPRSALYGGRIVHLIHDETIGEHPIDRAPEALAEQRRLMVEPARWLLPGMTVKTSGAILEERWRKC